MKFVSATHEGVDCVGVVDGAEIVLLPPVFGDLVAIVEGGEQALDDARAYVANPRAERLRLESVRLCPPIRRFRRDILCTGWNYFDHFEEGKGKRDSQAVKELPKAPTFFTKGPDTVIGPTDPIAYDARISDQWDFEAEIAIVIGKVGRSIPESEAADHIFGYCLANDVSQRDLQKRHGGQWLKGKSIDGTMPIGPFVATADEVDLPNVRLECVLNGQVVQSAMASQMAFPISRLVSELSFGMTLRPGDLILTGTPAGVGFARNPPIFLADGDEVVVRATGLGALKNRIEHRDLFERSDLIHR